MNLRLTCLFECGDIIRSPRSECRLGVSVLLLAESDVCNLGGIAGVVWIGRLVGGFVGVLGHMEGLAKEEKGEDKMVVTENSKGHGGKKKGNWQVDTRGKKARPFWEGQGPT